MPLDIEAVSTSPTRALSYGNSLQVTSLASLLQQICLETVYMNS